jgi:NAD(P)-dependent dehydrogenase (short-subunit alcohol dehydrogenase family)
MKPSIWQALEGAKLVREKTALITGAAAAVGKACALLFAHQGARLALVDVQEEQLRISAGKSSPVGLAVPIASDLTSAEAVESIFKTTLNTFGGLDILINNARGGLPTDFFPLPWQNGTGF